MSKGHKNVLQISELKELRMFSLVKKKLSEDMIGLFRYLKVFLEEREDNFDT